MLYDVLPIVILFSALAGIVIVVGRRWSAIRVIDVAQIPLAVDATKKKQLLLLGLQRRFRSVAGNIWQRTATVRSGVGERLGDFYQRLLELDRRYRHTDSSAPANITTTDIRSLHTVAEDSHATGDTAEAEQTYLDIIKHDHSNVLAYRGLGRLYWDMGNTEEAFQSFEYALRLDPHDAGTHAALAGVAFERGATERSRVAYEQAVELDPENVPYRIALGDVLTSSGDLPSAIASFEAAVALEPANPRCLDRLIDVCILGGNKRLASSTLRQLKAVNPENNKIAEFEQRISAIAPKPRSSARS